MTKILIIEDEVTLLEEIVDLLTFEDFEVYGTDDSREGVQLALTHVPDLILCDIMMPHLDGYGVLLELQNHSETMNIPFIFVTAKADRSHMRYGMELGADDYITKPFTRNELLSAINTRLEKHDKIQTEQREQLDGLRHAILLSLPHELRTPLTGIIGYAELMKMDSAILTPEQVAQMSETILKAGRRLYHLIENYLLYAQLEIAGINTDWMDRVKDASTPNAGPAIEDIAQTKALTYQRTADLTLEIANATVSISQESLYKLAEELIDNAFKFSKPGQAVRITTHNADDCFWLTVRDEGRGMSPNQARLAGAYMQFDRKIHEQQGSGMGLAIARKLAEIFAGKLTLDSQPNGYTQVTVRLPLYTNNGTGTSAETSTSAETNASAATETAPADQ